TSRHLGDSGEFARDSAAPVAHGPRADSHGLGHALGRAGEENSAQGLEVDRIDAVHSRLDEHLPNSIEHLIVGGAPAS
ncbi:MAG: hypothetical protein ACO3N4_06725, partial [Ilumatobacteraceae bacterium]